MNLDTRKRGGVAQLGEHLLCKQGVVSSSLIISTKGRLTVPQGELMALECGPIAQPVRARA